MKKMFGIMIIISLCAMICAPVVSAENLMSYDMASYGNTASITNPASVGSTLTYARVTHDAETTNTFAIFLTQGGVDYQLGTGSVTNARYVDIDITDVFWKPGGVLKFTTTDTNVNVLISSH